MMPSTHSAILLQVAKLASNQTAQTYESNFSFFKKSSIICFVVFIGFISSRIHLCVLDVSMH